MTMPFLAFKMLTGFGFQFTKMLFHFCELGLGTHGKIKSLFLWGGKATPQK